MAEDAPYPDRIGRFEVIAPLGEGGMGRVFRAQDPQLSREVAIKVLGAGQGVDIAAGQTINLREASPGLPSEPSGGTEVLARPGYAETDNALGGDLLAEARAMAQLSHPNVVSVYELGRDGDRLYLAMELVQGRNLRDFLEQDEPSRTTVLDLFRRAARGLGAAHAAGLIHRDFKPDNVLIGDDGSVRVADFGLAQSPTAARPSMVRIDSVAGTPGYMAPEIAAGHRATRASDVYAFCVSLVEALGGKRPERELSKAEARDLVRSLGRLPRATQKGLVAGLASDPADRPVDGSALADMLTPPRVSGRLLGGGAALAAVSATAVLLLWPANAAESCADWPRLEASWSAEVASSVRANVASIDHPLAEASAARVADTLAQRVDRLRTARVEVCRDRDDDVVSGDIAAARIDCLGHELVAFEALVETVSEPLERSAAERLIRLVGKDRIGECATRGAVPIEPTGASALRARLERINKRAALAAKPIPADGEVIDSVLADAQAIGADRVVALARFEKADRARRSASYDEAKTALREVAKLASAAGDERLAVRALLLVVDIAVGRHRSFDEADSVLAVIETKLEKIPNADDLWSRYHRLRGVRLRKQNRYDEAAAALEDAMAALERAPYAPPGRAEEIRFDRAALLVHLSRHEEAAELFATTAQMQSARMGDMHPTVLNTRSARGLALIYSGNAAEAVKELDRVIAMYAKLGGRDGQILAAKQRKALALDKLGEYRRARDTYKQVLDARLEGDRTQRSRLNSTHFHLARSSFLLGDYATAREHYQRAHDLYVEQLGSDHRYVANALSGLGRVETFDGDAKRAEQLISKARAMRESIFGPGATAVAVSDTHLSEIYRRTGRFEQALAAARRARIKADESNATNVAVRAYAQFNEAAALLEMSRAAEAAPLLERALALFDPKEDRDNWARTRAALGRALYAIGERDKGRAMVVESTAILRSFDSRQREHVADLERWLARHK